MQLQNLQEEMKSVKLVPMADRWVWTLENSGVFTVASLRKKIDELKLAAVAEKTRWVKYVPLKVNITAWKVKVDGFPTRFNMSRRGIGIQSLVCPICNCSVESTEHLFFRCSLIRELGCKVLGWWNFPVSTFESYGEWVDWLVSLRIPSKTKLLFEGVWSVMWWYVWNFRNKILFDEKPPKKSMLFDAIVSSSFNWCKFRSKASFGWNDWLKNPYCISL